MLQIRTCPRGMIVCLAILIGGRLAHCEDVAQPESPEAIAEVVIPSDPTAAMGPVVAEEPIPTKSLWDMLWAGGPMLVPIFVCSFVLLLVVFERTVSLRRGRVLPRPFVKRLLLQLRENQIDRDEALQRCEENSSHVSRVFAAALRKWGRPAVEVEQAILDEGERVSNTLRRYLRVINGVATVSPLMGVLGTGGGMMAAFNAIATTNAMGRPELLAGGISQALLTTAAGLFVAIPALILYLFFVGRVDKLVMDIDARGQDLVNLISAEALQDRKHGKSSGGLSKTRQAA